MPESESRPKAPDYEPEPQNRVWYRHAAMGDIGWMVRSDGKDMIRLDRGADLGKHHLRPYKPGDWVQQEEHRPMTQHHLALITWSADRAVCKAMGFSRTAKDWAELKDEERIEWIKHGPPSGIERKVVFNAIQTALKGFVG